MSCETPETARQLVIGRLAAFKSEPSGAALQSLKQAVDGWLKATEMADPGSPSTLGTRIS